MWDVEYQVDPNLTIRNRACRGTWSLTPSETTQSLEYPLTIAGSPMVLPVSYRWPPGIATGPPPDPRPSEPINASTRLDANIIRDIFTTFEGSIGCCILITGLLQLIVLDDFDMTWASSHLPHRFGGLKVCYIYQTLEPTTSPSTTKIQQDMPQVTRFGSSISGLFRPSKVSTTLIRLGPHLNDHVEARCHSKNKYEKFSGRIGLKVSNSDHQCILMSTHVITEAILAKSRRELLIGRNRDPVIRLANDWNDQVQIWAGNEQVRPSLLTGPVDLSADRTRYRLA